MDSVHSKYINFYYTNTFFVIYSDFMYRVLPLFFYSLFPGVQDECRGWDISEVVFTAAMWPTYQPLLRDDFTVFDEYIWRGEGEACFPFFWLGFLSRYFQSCCFCRCLAERYREKTKTYKTYHTNHNHRY
jgi:hypothetical protein